jgi:hypothetical protein
MRYVVLIFLAFWVISCTSDQDVDLRGEWVSAHIRFDKDLYQPLLSHIEIFGDSAVVTPFLDPRPDTFPMLIEADTLRIDTTVYGPEDFGMSGPFFTYRRPYSISMYRPEDAQLMASRIEIRNMLREKAWGFGEEVWHLKAEGEALIQPAIDEPANQHCWSVKEVGGSIFLVLSGNQVGCDMLSHPLYQVVDFDDEALSLRFAEKDEIKKRELRLIEAGEPEVSDFQLCNRYLNLGLPSHHYYYQGTRLVGGHYLIRKILKEHYDAGGGDFTGLVRVRFVVNCEGKTGLFETVCYDQDYMKVEKDTLAGHLEDITRKLGPWVPGTYSGQGGQPIDTYCFIGYKIKDGEVVDILP